jgi:hypothetical protein
MNGMVLRLFLSLIDGGSLVTSHQAFSALLPQPQQLVRGGPAPIKVRRSVSFRRATYSFVISSVLIYAESKITQEKHLDGPSNRDLLPGWAQNWAEWKMGRFQIGPKLLVRKGGLEPPRFYPPDPKSGASANSATFARIYSLLFLTAVGKLSRV